MADQEQLELLKQGVKIWNQWAGELRPHQSLIPIQLLTRSFLTLLLVEQPLSASGGTTGRHHCRRDSCERVSYFAIFTLVSLQQVEKGGEHGNICAGAWGMGWGLVLAEGHPPLRRGFP